MSTAAILAIIGLISTVVTAGTTMYQANKEKDFQREMFGEQTAYQSEREDIAFERSLPSTTFQDLIDEGFNPNIAANAVLGNGGTSADSHSAPTPPAQNSAIQALQSALGQGSQQFQDIALKSAEIQNINANTNKTEVEAGLMPRDFQLRRMSTAAQINAWESSAKLACRQAKLTEEQTKLVENQNLYYGRLSEAQIESYKAQVMQFVASAINQLEQAKTEDNKRRNIDANTAVQAATEENIHSSTQLINTEQVTEYYKSERERIAKEFEEKLGNIPLTADAQKMVNAMIKNGDYEGVENFYNTIFSTALNQNLGEGQGNYWTTPDNSFGLPFGIYNIRGRMPISRMHKHGFYNLPYWNPSLMYGQ